eukprot:747869-Hanusia_phi.AAC.1
MRCSLLTLLTVFQERRVSIWIISHASPVLLRLSMFRASLFILVILLFFAGQILGEQVCGRHDSSTQTNTHPQKLGTVSQKKCHFGQSCPCKSWANTIQRVSSSDSTSEWPTIQRSLSDLEKELQELGGVDISSYVQDRANQNTKILPSYQTTEHRTSVERMQMRMAFRK